MYRQRVCSFRVYIVQKEGVCMDKRTGRKGLQTKAEHNKKGVQRINVQRCTERCLDRGCTEGVCTQGWFTEGGYSPELDTELAD